VQLGLTLYTLGRAAEAVEQWRAVLERDPSRDDARTYIRMVSASGKP
jgi:cytochrome c-type biogenesis protein CcmH/NrfG